MTIAAFAEQNDTRLFFILVLCGIVFVVAILIIVCSYIIEMKDTKDRTKTGVQRHRERNLDERLRKAFSTSERKQTDKQVVPQPAKKKSPFLISMRDDTGWRQPDTEPNNGSSADTDDDDDPWGCSHTQKNTPL